MKTYCLICLIALLYYFSISSCLAVSISIDQSPSSITNDPFSVTVSVLGASSGQNYLRVDLFKEGSNNYFGETNNGNDWHKDSDGTHYYPITIIDSKTSVSATIQARLGLPTQGEFSGEGAYKLRVRRYTASGNQGDDDMIPATVQIAYSFPTATPTPTDVPTPTRAPTPTKYPSPTSLPTPTKVSTLTQSQEVLPGDKEGATLDDDPTEVLGANDQQLTPTPLDSPKPSPVLTKGIEENESNYTALILCSLGVILLSTCGILVFLNKRKEKIV